jgi:hypothetical protein
MPVAYRNGTAMIIKIVPIGPPLLVWQRLSHFGRRPVLALPFEGN